jgi:Protein of unknown function (DUF3631)
MSFSVPPEADNVDLRPPDLVLAPSSQPPESASEAAAESSGGLRVPLLDELAAFVRRFVVVSPAQAAAIALWIVHSHAFDAADASPYLAVTSPEKRSGKSRLFEVLEILVANPWKVITPTEAVVFRKIDGDRPTLLLDETDAIFGKKAENHEGLRALLNAGNRRGTFVPRCVGTSQTLVSFSVFCPKAIAGIGELPDTIADRAIPIRLKRKARTEHAERFRRRDVEAEAKRLYMDASAWAEHAVPALTDARPALPDELDDRAQDAWEPLLAIADLAGEKWSKQARAAALELLNGTEGEEESAGVLLLADARRVFDEQNVDRLSSAALVAALHEIEESQWAEWYGKPITQTGIARLLKRYGVQPRKLRFGEETARGYERAWFEDEWERYLPSDTGSNRNRRNIGSTKPLNQADVPGVPVDPPDTGEM